MEHSGQYIHSEYIKIGSESAIVTVCLAEQFIATWECSCGFGSSAVMQALTIAAAAELGKENYSAHCAAAHP